MHSIPQYDQYENAKSTQCRPVRLVYTKTILSTAQYHQYYAMEIPNNAQYSIISWAPAPLWSD